MQTEPKFSHNELVILEVLFRDFKEFNSRDIEKYQEIAPRRTLNEIQIYSNLNFEDSFKAIGFLILGGYVKSQLIRPSIFQILKGRKPIYKYWITAKGISCLLKKNVNTFKTKYIESFEHALFRLGYRVNSDGISIAEINYENGYSYCEAASFVALTTLALDVKEAKNDVTRLADLAGRAQIATLILREFRETNKIREAIYKNDVTAMFHVTYVDQNQLIWIEKILDDPLIKTKRIAKHNED